MCHGHTHAFLQALPKCEHHMHLEGSLKPTLLFKLAEKNGIKLPSTTTDPAFESPATLLERYNHFTSLDDFLHYYYLGMSVLKYESDFEDLAYDYFTHAAHDGVMHAEVFFDPQAHAENGIAYATVVEGFTKACQRAEQDLGISTKLILCFLRHLPVNSALATLDLARADLQKGVLGGIGLDSSEVPFPPELFKPVYESAKASGIRRTARAGEEGPPDYIRTALQTLDIQRIDHGIRLVEDDALLEEVAQRGIMLTVCPISNVQLRCVEKVSEVPIRKFLEKGIKFSINSDDPAYFGGFILDNYCAVHDAFQLSINEWEKVANAGIEGSWCGEQRKQEMLKRLDEVIQKYNGKI